MQHCAIHNNKSEFNFSAFPSQLITMLVAMVTVHAKNGWLAIADSSSWLANERVVNSSEQLSAAKSLLQQHGNYDWLTSNGNLVILNNGIEFAATYFVMLLSLFFSGGGRYTSVDHYLSRHYRAGQH